MPVLPMGALHWGVSAHTVTMCVVVWKSQSALGSDAAFQLNAALVCWSFFVPCSAIAICHRDRCAAKHGQNLHQNGFDLSRAKTNFWTSQAKKCVWRRAEVLRWWVGAVQLCCCSSASQDSAGSFPEPQSCRSNHSTEQFLPGRWEQSAITKQSCLPGLC